MRVDTPHVTKRILQLRPFAMFERADLAELAVIAERVVERTFQPGELVNGDRPASLQLVLDGELDHGGSSIGPRQAHGALEIASGRAARTPTVARTRTRTLELDGSEYLDILEDNFGLLRTFVRDLARRTLALAPAERPLAMAQYGRFGFVERMIVLRQLFPFESGRLEPLAILAHAAAERRWPEGALVRSFDSPRDAALVVLDGSLRSDGRIVGAGHAVGAVEALAGLAHFHTLESVTPVRALEIPASAILDVLEDHTDFAFAIVQSFARVVLDDEARKACTPVAAGANPTHEVATGDDHGWRTS